ncbi:MAG: hypothetical protein S4CHLAM20_10800 [Chlamydiia bacterium]|nr:hypothetical protein [Chlamydiia bacterium]
MFIAAIIIFILLLIDSLSCVLVMWCGDKWYTTHFRWFSRMFPPAKGWSLFYFILSLWIGYLTIFRV